MSSLPDQARITFPISSATELTDRENYQGQVGSKVFTCLAEGNPEPSLSWYYNGDPITGINGVNENSPQLVENNTQLIITSPQSTHSGIYQCLVRNVISGISHVDQRIWILEIKVASERGEKNYCCVTVIYTLLLYFLGPTYFEPLLTTNPLAMQDNILGILLIIPDNISNLVLTAVVSLDPCVPVQWTFNGTNIPTNDFLVNFTDPCSDNYSFPPYMYNLTIPPSTQLNSGFYSAKFDNGGPESIILPKVFVTLSGTIIEKATPAPTYCKYVTSV